MASESAANRFGPSPFARLARTHALAMAGDTLVTLALAGSLFFSISPTAARGRVILSLVLTMAPFAVVAPVLGPMVDRSRAGRRTIVALTNVGRALACLAMTRVLDGLLLFPAAFTVLVLSKTYSVAKSALVPTAVDDTSLLVEANSKLAITGVLSGFLASGPGVLLLRFAGAEWTLGLAVVAFVSAAISAFTIEGSPREAVAPKAVERVRRGFAIALHLSAGAVATALLRAMVGFVTFLIAFAFRRQGAASWEFGVVLASSMAANLAGAAVAPALRTRVREEFILIGALAIVAVAGFGMARVRGMLYASVVAAAVALAAAAGRLAFDAIVQRDAQEEVRGRVFARFETGFQLVWVIGALLPVLVATPLRQGYDVLGIAAAAGAVAYAVASRRLTPKAG